MQIKLCKKYPKKNKLVKKLTSNFLAASIIMESCIDMCKYCKLMPTAIVDGKKVKKKSIKKFIKTLDKK